MEIPDKKIPNKEINDIIKKALSEAFQKRINGAELTPFLLAKITELSGGKSLEANIILVKNNVRLACRIAKEL